MKNVFIDLGAYEGLYIKKFRNSSMYVPGCEVYAFEANPHIRDINYGDDVTVKNVAAWTEDGELQFYVSRKTPHKVQGSSVYKEKITGNLDKEYPVRVKCIDFSKWIKENFSPDDNIILKCNIEGSEYDILEKMIADETIEYIKELWIRWHWKRCGIPEQRHLNLVIELNKYSIKQHMEYGDFK